MLHSRVLNWITGLTISLRLSQRKTLGELVFGAMRRRRVSLADIGRSLCTKTTAKRNIRRIWRFLKNNLVDVHEGAKELIHIAAKAARGRLFVAVDWVDKGQYKVLRAAVPLRGWYFTFEHTLTNFAYYSFTPRAFENNRLVAPCAEPSVCTMLCSCENAVSIV